MSPRRLTRKWDDAIADLLARVSDATKVSTKRLQSTERTAHVAKARAVAWLVLRQKKCSLPDIGALTGGFNHSTVFTALRKATEREHRIANMILGKDIGLKPEPKVFRKPNAAAIELRRRELLFRGHIQRWRELCAEDSQYAANKAVVVEHFDRMREVKQAQKAGPQ